MLNWQIERQLDFGEETNLGMVGGRGTKEDWFSFMISNLDFIIASSAPLKWSCINFLTSLWYCSNKKMKCGFNSWDGTKQLFPSITVISLIFQQFIDNLMFFNHHCLNVSIFGPWRYLGSSAFMILVLKMGTKAAGLHILGAPRPHLIVCLPSIIAFFDNSLLIRSREIFARILSIVGSSLLMEVEQLWLNERNWDPVMCRRKGDLRWTSDPLRMRYSAPFVCKWNRQKPIVRFGLSVTDCQA